MRFKRLLLILLFLIPAVGFAARRKDPHGVHTTTQDPNWMGLMRSMDRMHAAMASVEPSGNCDLDFVRLMMPHHQAALEMAKTELMYGRNPQMRRLAQEIITDQESEIQLMELWLKDHDANSHSAYQKSRANAGEE